MSAWIMLGVGGIGVSVGFGSGANLKSFCDAGLDVSSCHDFIVCHNSECDRDYGPVVDVSSVFAFILGGDFNSDFDSV